MRTSELEHSESAVGAARRLSLDVVSIADEILTSIAPRAITMLTTPRRLDDGRTLPPRLSVNDCYAALSEACRKMARVVSARRRKAVEVGQSGTLEDLFPEPAAYLAKAICSVVSDEGRRERRQPQAISLDQPMGGVEAESECYLADLLREEDPENLPEDRLLDAADRGEFRSALRKALRSVPKNYVAALVRDIRRERMRRAGQAVAPATDAERQTLCRARAALAAVIRGECTPDNPYVHMLGRQRKSNVPKRAIPTQPWTGERQDALLRRLLEIGWANRSANSPDGRVVEAVVNDVTEPGAVAPPSPEVRQAVRVLDLYTVDRNTPATEPARSLYEDARRKRADGRVEEALDLYRRSYEAEPSFLEALNEVGVMYSRLGRLQEALDVYLSILEKDPVGPHRFIAATNAADIYLTWYDAGRDRKRNLALARKYAEMAMVEPSPMRACNLILALVKAGSFEEAREVMEGVLRRDAPKCPARKFLQTMFQIRDPDLVRWWSWLEETLAGSEE